MQEVGWSFSMSKKEYVRSINIFYTILNKHSVWPCLIVVGFNYFIGILMLYSANYLGFALLIFGSISLWSLLQYRLFQPSAFYKKDKDLNKLYQVVINTSGVRFSIENAHSFFEWSYFEKVLETKEYYFLIYGKEKAFLLPKKLNEDEKILLKKILEQQSVKHYLTSIQ